MKVWVYVAADTVVGVYATEELAEVKGLEDSLKQFGVDGFYSEYEVIEK